MKEAELLLWDAWVAEPCVVLFFKVTVVDDFCLEVCGLALKELVLTFVLLTDVWFIELGSGDVSSTRLPPLLMVLLLPTKMFFFWIYEVLFTRTDRSGVQGIVPWTWIAAFVLLLEPVTSLLLERARELLRTIEGCSLTLWLLFCDLLSKLMFWPWPR